MSFSRSQSLSGGIPLPSDSPLRAGIRKRFQRKVKRAEDPTIELGDAESNIMTEPKLGAPSREPTMTLGPDELEIVDTPDAPMKVSQPPPKPLTGARREESVLFKLPGETTEEEDPLASLNALDSVKDEKPAANEPKRESSVMLSLASLREIEVDRVAREEADAAEAAALERERADAEERRVAEERRAALEAEAGISTIVRLTKFFKKEGEAQIIGSGYRLTLKSMDNDSCAFTLESKAEGYNKTFNVKRGAEWSESMPDDSKVVLEWSGPTEAGSYKVQIAMVSKPPEEDSGKEVDELLADLEQDSEPTMDIDLADSMVEKVEAASEEKPPGAIKKAISGFFGFFGFGKKKDAPSSEPPEAASEEEETEDETSEFILPPPKPDGVPWKDEHVQFAMSEGELTMCEGVMDERKVFWILPVPQADEPNADKVIGKLKDEPMVRLGGKKYFVFSAEEGFAGAKMASRVGKELHVWPVEATDYDYLGSISIEIRDPRKDEVAWPKEMNTSYVLSLQECADCNYFLPDNKPRWLHPVPRVDTKNETDIAILETMKGTQQITLKGQKFYLLNVTSVKDWREMILYLPRTRIATRGNTWLSVWNQEENGKYMFFNSGSFSSSYYGERGKSLKQTKEAKVYDTEKMEVELVFDKMQKVWLYELDDLANMNSNELGWIVKSANSTVQKHGISPLMSISGRWYVALDIFVPDSMMAGYDGSMVRLLTEKTDTKTWIAKMRAARKSPSGRPQRFSLPPEAEEKKQSIFALPEGEVRYLLPVDDEFQGRLYRPWVSMSAGGSKNRLLIMEEPHEGTIAVVRRGNQVFFAKIEGEEDDDSIELALD